MNSKTFFRMMLALVTLTFIEAASHAQTSAAQSTSLANTELMICFQGKGANLAYDGGVLREAAKRLPALRGQRSIVAGNSSGSILAVFFSCFGFNDASLAKCDYNLINGDRTVIRKMQDSSLLAFKSITGKRTEIDHIEMKAFVAFALGVDNYKHLRTLEDVARNSSVVPKYPMLIVAGNREVLFDRGQGDLLAARNYKVFNPKNWTVSWQPEVYDFYKNHPARFATDNPDLVLGDSPYIGRALTYFVNQPMYDLLRQIPPEERTGDLRLVETPHDLMVAIMASVSEPTYFDPYKEPHPEKILCQERPGELGTSCCRSYCGGAFSNLPAQDVRRMLPGVHVLGSGYTTVPYAAREMIKAWYLTDIEQLARSTGWWCDMELQQSAEMVSNAINARDLKPEQEIAFGAQMAKDAFDRNEGLPKYVTIPYYADAAASAINNPSLDAAETWETSPDNLRRLKTMRGMGSLDQ